MAVTEVREEVRQPEPYRRPKVVEWLTTTDHKKIGLLYIGTAFVFFLVGGSLAEMIRTQLFNHNSKLFTFARYDQIFTMHALIMIFLFVRPVTAALAALLIDRNFGGHFFDPTSGGNAILWQHMFWFFGHPEVYILILPSMGIVSEILPVFSRKPLFGYKAFVFATLAIGMLSFAVWAHHMFATGAVYAPFFAFMTGAIAVPTGVKFFNWIATMWRGQLRFTTAMLFAIGFLMLVLIGGIDGLVLG